MAERRSAEEAARSRASRRPTLRQVALVLWYVLLLVLIFLLHDFPNREFRYWKL